jgi:hypothetical protein
MHSTRRRASGHFAKYWYFSEQSRASVKRIRETLTSVGSFRISKPVARPKRATSASTTIITFRLTVDEARQLDAAVKELGFKDRSGLLRMWLAQLPSVARGTGESPSPPVQANTVEGSVHPENNVDETMPARSTIKEETSQHTELYVHAIGSMCHVVALVIYREADSRSGWSRIPNAVRVLLPHMALENALLIMDAFRQAGVLELRPPNGRFEQVRAADAALCPRDSRGNVLSRARLTGKGLELVRRILPPNPG